jgi:GNAT superfamily N-acetyltransferase
MPSPTDVLTTIRSAVLDDAPALAPLLGELGYPAEAVSVRGRLDHLLHAAATGGADAIFVAQRAGDDVVGLLALHRFTGLHADAPVALITALVVAERARGAGVGRQLVDRAVDEARAWGCGRLMVTTHIRRADAHAFYERIGFEFTGRRYARGIW